MECNEACRNFATHSTPAQCHAGQTSVQCVMKKDSKVAYTCGKPGSDAKQFCHHPNRATGKATNTR